MQDHENNVIIDTKISIELPRDDMEMPPDPPKFPINKENEKIKITENKNSKTFDNIEIKPYIHDISSTFSIMSIYNEATKQIEIYDLNETYKTQTEQTEENTIDNSSNENVELKLLWTYKIESDKLRSMKIIENEEYPLICINTTEGIDILTLKTGEIYQVIKINEGGNNKTKWSPTRPTELVNLSYNHTLFTYDIIKRQYEIISSGVSCFIITTKGEILFINEDEIYICHNKEDILNKKRIFNNNINMLNVYEDKAIIISRKKEDTEGIILSLYEYENNEIRSFLYDRIKSDDIESIINDGNISSSILHSLVFIGLYKEETFLYLNCESVDHFEMMNIGDDKIISIPYDEDYDTEKIHGFKFIDKNINENLRFPSTIHFFGKNIINIYNIDSLSMEVEEPWYFPVQEPTEPPILFDELKLPTKKQINTSSTKPSKSTKSTKLKKSKTKKSRIQSVESPEEEEIETSEEAIISIDVSEEIKMEKTETESPVDPPKFPINKENEKIKITENKNNKTINNNEIKPYIHDISSTFSIMSLYNETTKQIEIYDLNETFKPSTGDNENENENDNGNENGNSELKLLWTYKIESDKLRSMKIIENEEYPLICINTTEGIDILTLKTGEIYQVIKINEGGNNKTKWSPTRPTELVNLSYNHTLFTYDIIKRQYEIISSGVSCFIITTKGEILFINEDEIYICHNKEDILNKKRIFNNNINMLNVYEDKAIIISRKKEDTEGIILSLYEYENNEIRSFLYDRIKSDDIESIINDGNISSSILHSLVFIGLYKEETFLYLNCESVDHFEMMNIGDDKIISIPYDEDYDTEKIHGFKFIDKNINENLRFPSTIHFFGKNIINIYNIDSLSMEVEEPWYFPVQEPTEPPILFDELKLPTKKQINTSPTKSTKHKKSKTKKSQISTTEPLGGEEIETSEEAIISIDVSKEIKMEKTETESPVDPPKFPINKENEKIKITENKNNKTINNNEIKPYIHDISSTFSIMSLYNETTKQIEIYDLNETFKPSTGDNENENENDNGNGNDNSELKLLWTYKIESDKLRSMKIIENEEYPLICINTTEGIDILTLKTGEIYQVIKINEGGNNKTRWSPTRPTELVNLSYNHTLFTYDIIKRQYEIISSGVSCFIITTKGEILFINEDEIYICHNKEDILNKKRIFNNNINMLNVYEDKAIIISRKKEDTEGIILSLYEYENNEIRSFLYDRIKSDDIESIINDGNISSSILHSLVFIGLYKEETFLYLNCESIDHFEMMNIGDDKIISIPYDEDYDTEKIHGFKFIDKNINENLRFPSTIHFFGKNIINIYNIDSLSMEVEEPWYFPVQEPTEPPILFDELKLPTKKQINTSPTKSTKHKKSKTKKSQISTTEPLGGEEIETSEEAIISIDVSEEIKMEKTETESPVDPPKFPINKENEKIKITENKNNKTINNNEIKPYIHDISSTFSIMSLYNETTKQIEIYDLNETFKPSTGDNENENENDNGNENGNSELKLLWTYKIESDKLRSMKIIENEEYPLICINTTEGIDILTLKTGEIYQVIKINEGGNNKTKWSPTRPTELVNLSYNHTLFTYDIIKRQYEIISSGVSCFIITTKGEILFINEDEIYICHNKEDILNKKRIFNNNINMLNVYEDKAIIISRKKEDTEGIILSLYEYENNEIRSFLYDRIKSDDIESIINDGNISSSILHSLVFIGLYKEETFLYLNCESVDHFEMMNIGDDKIISIPYDEDYDTEKIHGFKFIDKNINENLRFPSTIHFFGKNIINIYNIDSLSMEVEEPWYFPVQEPTEPPILFDELKLPTKKQINTSPTKSTKHKKSKTKKSQISTTEPLGGEEIETSEEAIISIDVSKEIKMEKTETESPVDPPKFPINKENEKIKITENKNNKTINNNEIKPYIHDISSTFSIMSLYNETTKQIEIYDLNETFKPSTGDNENENENDNGNGNDNSELKLLWTYKIESDKLRSMKIIENEEYPLICINTTEGIDILTLKTGEIYQVIKINEGGNNKTKWSPTRPTELINLSYNHTLFTYDIIKRQYEIISSGVSCFIITTKGEILFINEDEIYICHNKEDILNKKRIFNNNINMLNVYEDKAIIISRKKEDTEGIILSLYEYENNEIRSFLYDRIKSDDIESIINDGNISSSILHSLVFIGLYKEETFLYLNCESVDHFEMMNIGDDKIISIPYDEDYDTEKIHGFKFIDKNINENLRFPSTIHFFGKNIINIYNIDSLSMEVEEPWYFPVQEPTEPPILFDELKLPTKKQSSLKKSAIHKELNKITNKNIEKRKSNIIPLKRQTEEIEYDEEEEEEEEFEEEEEEEDFDEELIDNVEQLQVSIDVSKEIKMEKTETESPVDPPKFPINKENEKIKITENKNNKTIDNNEIKPYIHDISSTFSIMSLYNETTKQIEIYDLNETFKPSTGDNENENENDNGNGNDNSELKLLWTYKIESDKLRSMKIIENEEYPLICINTTEGIDILTLKTGEIYQVIKINEGGNNKTKWSPTRPTELVNLSYNHTLFTYDIIKRQHEIISSGVSCFIITTKGEILFINEDEIYICHNKEDILNKKRIFNNNINMLNVYEDKAIIISRKKEDTEGIILSLYEYENNEIRSFLYDRIKSDDIESIINDGNISSSILHSLVFIGLYKEETFLYLNCESVDHFEVMNIGDDKIISIPYDENHTLEKIHGFKFIDKNINENLRFPSTIHFFGKNIINIYNIDSLSTQVKRPWLFSIQEPSEPSILYKSIINAVKIKKVQMARLKASTVSVDVNKKVLPIRTQLKPYRKVYPIPINSQNNDIKIFQSESSKAFQKMQFKPYVYDVSSHFGIMCVYNELTKQVETYDLNKVFNSHESHSRSKKYKYLWSFKTDSNSIKSMKIIENEEYPLICINTTEGIDILTLKTGEIYQVIKINEGGNNKTKWSPTRPTELVNLSYNHTLFTYDIIKRQYEIISSGVSCFIITTKGEILFINEDEIYICHNKEDILNKKRIFNNNINMLNVYEDKAIIISRKKEDTEGIILSLYEYENNEIRSFLYDRIKSDDIESIINDGNISSSILHSLVFIGLYKEETFLYLNCESVDHFEMMNIGDDKIISIPYDEDYDTEKIHGFKFIDKNINENLRFPSTIHFFGKNTINIYNIDSLPPSFAFHEASTQPLQFDDVELPPNNIKKPPSVQLGKFSICPPSRDVFSQRHLIGSNNQSEQSEPASTQSEDQERRAFRHRDLFSRPGQSNRAFGGFNFGNNLFGRPMTINQPQQQRNNLPKRFGK